MKILYDGLTYSMQQTGGISRYFENIIENLSVTFKPIISKRTDSQTISIPNNKRLGNIPVLHHHNWTNYNTIGEYLALSLYQKFVRPNVLHPTYYDLICYKKFGNSFRFPIVLTVFDMIHEKIIQHVDPKNGIPHVAVKKNAIFRSDHIICISENTKTDLLYFYPELINKPISVTPLAASLDPGAIEINTRYEGNPYFLYVGSRDPTYKNFDTLLHAFSKLAHNKNLMIKIVGSVLTSDEIKLATDLKIIDNLEVQGITTDANLVSLYKNAVALVYPSLYEGFGIPPLEAMLCNCLVICSNTSSLPEVTADAALQFNPLDESQLTNLLEYALTITDIKKQDLLKKGLRQAKKFDWNLTAKRTEAIYQSFSG